MFWHLIISRSTYAIKAISPEWSCTIYIAKIASSVPRNHLQLKSHKNTVSSIQLLRLFIHVSACPPQSQSFLSCRKMTNTNDEQHGLWPCGHLLLAWYSAWVQDPSPTQLIGFWWSSSAYWAPRCHTHERPLIVGLEIWENCVICGVLILQNCNHQSILTECFFARTSRGFAHKEKPEWVKFRFHDDHLKRTKAIPKAWLLCRAWWLSMSSALDWCNVDWYHFAVACKSGYPWIPPCLPMLGLPAPPPKKKSLFRKAIFTVTAATILRTMWQAFLTDEARQILTKGRIWLEHWNSCWRMNGFNLPYKY